jgi:hypothetical protein
MPGLIRHLWQLKIVVFLRWCLIRAQLLTLNMNDIQHDCMLCYAECRYAERHDFLNVMLSVVMLSVVVPQCVLVCYF